MDANTFKRLYDEAEELARLRPLPLDTIFLALVTEQALHRPRKARKAAPGDEAPEWFRDYLTAHAGERLTVSQLLFRCGRFPITAKDRNDAGRWLREHGKTPAKRGGKLLFTL